MNRCSFDHHDYNHDHDWYTMHTSSFAHMYIMRCSSCYFFNMHNKYKCLNRNKNSREISSSLAVINSAHQVKRSIFVFDWQEWGKSPNIMNMTHDFDSCQSPRTCLRRKRVTDFKGCRPVNQSRCTSRGFAWLGRLFIWQLATHQTRQTQLSINQHLSKSTWFSFDWWGNPCDVILN